MREDVRLFRDRADETQGKPQSIYVGYPGRDNV